MEFADKILAYRFKNEELSSWIYNNIKPELLNTFKDDGEKNRYTEVDPFTVMALFNRGISVENRIYVCEMFKEFLKIEADVPEDFTGLPIMNYQNNNFVAYREDRREGDIKRNSFVTTRNTARDDIELESFKLNVSKPIIDEIDKVLAKHYGFTEEELDFIINYDIKYRMGDELGNDEE